MSKKNKVLTSILAKSPSPVILTNDLPLTDAFSKLFPSKYNENEQVP